MRKIAFLLVLVILCTALTGCVEMVGKLLSAETFMGENVHTMKIEYDSMYPEFSAGDTIVYRDVEEDEEFKVGDVIVYWTVIDGQRAKNAHRISAIFEGGDGRLLFQTKGDNNTSADPLIVSEQNIIGVYMYKK